MKKKAMVWWVLIQSASLFIYHSFSTRPLPKDLRTRYFIWIPSRSSNARHNSA
jgi:hypothetical protein